MGELIPSTALTQVPRGRIKFASCSLSVTDGTIKNKFMFIHGGYCKSDNSIFCNDFFKYEIPYASQFYYYTRSSSEPNKWTLLDNLNNNILNRAEH